MKLRNLVPKFMRSCLGKSLALRRVQRDVIEAKILAAQLLINHVRSLAPDVALSEAEFRVFSQFGEDGILQYLIHRLKITCESFIEFGVEDYNEANTRFLLMKDNWRGLVMDGSESNMRSLRSDDIYWQHDLTAVHAFITRENICDLIEKSGFAGEVGVLSIDLDGNDYWVWERLTNIDPIVVIVEYNSLFGAGHAVSIPYDPAFSRSKAHHSNLYWGCSLPALVSLGEKKGYRFVGSNLAGCNAFFVRADMLCGLRPLSAEEGYVEARFRQSRGVDGELTYLDKERQWETIKHLPVVDLVSRATVALDSLYESGQKRWGNQSPENPTSRRSTRATPR